MRKLKGTVISDAMQKTRVVEVRRLVRHARYGKYYTVTKRFKAHDAENAYKKGDQVVIQESRPLSKDKRWTIIEKISTSS